MKKFIAFIFTSCMISKSQAQQPLYQSNAFSVYNDKVVQGKYEAKAIAADHITSNYESPSNL